MFMCMVLVDLLLLKRTDEAEEYQAGGFVFELTFKSIPRNFILSPTG